MQFQLGSDCPGMSKKGSSDTLGAFEGAELRDDGGGAAPEDQRTLVPVHSGRGGVHWTRHYHIPSLPKEAEGGGRDLVPTGVLVILTHGSGGAKTGLPSRSQRGCRKASPL